MTAFTPNKLYTYQELAEIAKQIGATLSYPVQVRVDLEDKAARDVEMARHLREDDEIPL